MRQNFLKLNDKKTEFLLFGSRQQLSKVSLPFITIGDSQITPSSQARNLGVIFDSTMTLNLISPTSFAYDNFIPEILTEYMEILESKCCWTEIIHAFVTSRLDNGNPLFYGLPHNPISRLQHIQNTAARVVTLSRKLCHITPILKELHWLPVSQRIVFLFTNLLITLLQFIFRVSYFTSPFCDLMFFLYYLYHFGREIVTVFHEVTNP